MNEIQKRSILYGGAALVLGGIAAAWFGTSRDADLMTLLSSADVQLRMAYVLPAEDAEGRPVVERETLISSALSNLETVERIAPGMAVTAEFRGFARMLDGEFLEAADCYRRARECQDVQAEQRDVLAFNEARMLAKAGSRERALEVFGAHAKALDDRFGHQRQIEEATILRQLGRRQEATQRLEQVRRDDAAPPMARLQAAREFLELGHFDQAEQLLEALRPEVAIADYHLARLKLCRGDVDTSLELLVRANESRPTEVRQLLREDAGAWSAVAHDARFERLTAGLPASPGR